ncbi:hypothetical protein GOODEAATRI_011905 [Goodea atripinnis]|uniref:Nucleoprotein TPR/MPL1 domain-containing protein n=1 Tax=Goodea atripinnis TaxID=208336 RepID=A0ABV0MJ31_9TELE
MEQEKELLEKKIEWLTAELSTKTEELLSTNREKGKEILELQGSLESSNEQLYNAYAECQTQLQLEKQETRRVSKVLDEIVQEVESKAPVLKRQREEYESMQRSMASLCNKLEQARNLCNLLVELEEARGTRVSKDDGSSSDISSTSEVNGSSRLSFRKLESIVDKLQKEVEQLREQRNQHKQLADSSARQRDMFKALLTQSTGFSLPPQGQESTPRPSAPATRSTPQRAAAAESAQTAHAKAALKQVRVFKGLVFLFNTVNGLWKSSSSCWSEWKSAHFQLNDAFTLYKKEKAENDRMLNETNDRLQRQLTELRSSHAKLTSQLDFSNKRCV